MGIAGSLKRGFDLLSDTVIGGADFGEKNILSVIKYLLVSFLMKAAAGIAVGALLVGTYYLLPPAGAWVLALAALLAIAFALAGYVYSYAAEFGAMRFIYSGKKGGYFEGRNVYVALKWLLFVIGVIVAAAVCIGAPVFFLMGSGGESIIVLFMAILLMLEIFLFLCTWIIVGIVGMYYVQQELAVKRRGPVEAIRGSWGLVKGNFWETVVFAFAMYVLSNVALGIPVSVLYIGMRAGLLAFLLGPALWAVGIGIMVICGLLVIALSIIVGAALLILKVGFYKKLMRKGDVMEKEGVAQG